MVKNEIRAIGIDDAAFDFNVDSETSLVGVIYRGKNHFKTVLVKNIDVDGDNATSEIIKMIEESKFYTQLKVIFLSGITFGGFNIADIEMLYSKLRIPVIIILERKPDYESIKSALSNLSNFEERWNVLIKAGEVFRLDSESGRGKIYFQFRGATYQEAIDFIRNFQLKSNIPEPVRVAHIIAKILKRGFRK